MTFLLLDDFSSVGPWQALVSNGVPSAEVTAASVGERHPFATTVGALRMTASGLSLGHRLRRTFGPVNLSAYDRLTFWFRPETPMSGLPGDALQIKLRLGSAALPLDSAGNTWGRYLVGENGTGWAFAILSLADLPPAVAAAANQIEFRVTATDGASRSLLLDGMVLARPALIQDVDQALLALFDNALVIGGNPVPAKLAPEAAGPPSILIRQFGASRAYLRDPHGKRRIERDDLGMLLRPPPLAWDLFYRFEPVAANGADMATLLDFVASRLSDGWLPVGNRAFRVEKHDQPEVGDANLAIPPMRYVISAYDDTGAPIRATPAMTTDMHLEQQGVGA